MRGEKSLSMPTEFLQSGSSPRARGKETGKKLNRPIDEDHPRVRGEKVIYNILWIVFTGSSPRARGKVNGFL